MKKIRILLIFLLSLGILLNTYGAEDNIENYKRELTQDILKNINLKLPKIVQGNKNKNREESIMNIIKQLGELQKNYKAGDLEYDVLNEVILNLLLSQTQKTQNNNGQENSSGSTNENNGNQDQNKNNQDNNKGNQNQGKGNQNEDSNKQPPNNSRGQQIIPKGPSMGLGGEEGDAYKPLSPDEKGAIDSYIDSLKQEEKENMRLNKPNKRSQNIFDQFFDFDNDIGGGNYDW